jgi:phospholipid N-methyltransferase
LEGFLFLKQYIKNPRMIGAVLPSSRNLARKMIEDIDFEKAECIVEYGPGTGVFTKC